MDNNFEILLLSPLPLEVLAKIQDERHGTFTHIEYLTLEQIKEKYGEVLHT